MYYGPTRTSDRSYVPQYFVFGQHSRPLLEDESAYAVHYKLDSDHRGEKKPRRLPMRPRAQHDRPAAAPVVICWKGDR